MITDDVRSKYKTVFGRELEQDLPHIKYMIRNFVGMGTFTAPMKFDTNNVSMRERDFAMIAFLAMAALSEPKEEPTSQLEANVPIDV